jgi:uncharacterized membrane protein (DUF441 family)
MYPAVGMLLVIALFSWVFRDHMLMTAALLLAAVAATGAWPALTPLQNMVLTTLQKYAFQTGIFFLMVFIMLPIASQKISAGALVGQLSSIGGALAVVAGLAISFAGGKGVAVLASQPETLVGVILGTLIAVLFFDGLPAGLIIAAGLIGLLQKIPV